MNNPSAVRSLAGSRSDAACTVESKTRQVTEQLSQQEKLVADLHNVLSELEGQLVPLLTPVPPADSKPEPSAPIPVQIASRLRLNNVSIEGAIARINYLRNELHV